MRQPKLKVSYGGIAKEQLNEPSFAGVYIPGVGLNLLKFYNF